jgi:hypothetical protein
MRFGSFVLLVVLLKLAFVMTPNSGQATESSTWRLGSEIDLQTSSFPFTPDESLTTGSLCSSQDPDFAEYRYQEKIAYCKRSVSASDKEAVYRLYGVSKKCQKEYTIDHYIPLSVGGTNRQDNLWPEPKSIKALRKNLELELFQAVSNGRLTQSEAIQRIREAKLNPPVQDPSRFKFCL